MSDTNLLTNRLSSFNAAIPVAFIIMWSSGAIFVEFGLHYSKPFIFLFLRLLISAFILWGTVFYLKTPLPSKAGEWGYIILTGLCLQAGYQTFFFLALDKSISLGILTIILGAQPIITAIITKEWNQWPGLILGVVGLILVVADTLFISTITIIGILSAILSLMCVTIGTLMQKKIKLNHPSNMSIQYTGGAIILGFLTVFSSQSVSWTPMFIISLVWMVLIISVSATLLLYYMIQKGNLTNVTSLFYCVPAVTAVIDYLVFNNTLKSLAILGMLLIIFGLLLNNKKGKTNINY